MRPQWIIEKKRDSGELDRAEIRAFIAGYTTGSIPDYQMAALAMAVYFQGMTALETADLTVTMMESGSVIDPARIPGTKVDKHSTGGTLDKLEAIPGYRTSLTETEFFKALQTCGCSMKKMSVYTTVHLF